MILSSRRNAIFDTIHEISGLSEVADISHALIHTMEGFGFRAVGINGLPPPAEGADPLIVTEKMPEGFRGFYIDERLYEADHYCAHARVTLDPFRFRDAPYDGRESRSHQRFMQAMQSYGLGEGLVIPVGRPAALPACVWGAGERPDLDDDSIMAIQLIGLFAASKAYALTRPHAAASGARLTQRQREVLQWTAAGKTSWEISTILGLSERSINQIIADAMVALEAVTRAQALVNAIRIGEIEY